MKSNNPYTSPKFIFIIAIFVLIIVGVILFFLRKKNQQKRADKVKKILDTCAGDPNCSIDEKGNVTKSREEKEMVKSRRLNDAQVKLLATELVDDLEGVTFVVRESIWNQFVNLLDADFKEVVKEATRYIKLEKKSDIKTFKAWIDDEWCGGGDGSIKKRPLCSNREKIKQRMLRLSVE